VNLLDENIRDDQRALLRKWRIPFRQVDREISRAGIGDDDIVPLLHGLHRATLFTQDARFFKEQHCHDSYGLVLLAVKYRDLAQFIRRFLKHQAFDTQAKRFGVVA
jgi:hypothetical protein